MLGRPFFFLVAALLGAGPAAAAPVSCSAFRDAMVKNAGDLKADFVRPLVVGRANAGDQYDFVSRVSIDGTLRCDGERFISFEARIAQPSSSDLNAQFEQAQRAALMAALGWSQNHAQSKVHSLASDAADYLRASEERGDVAVSGKVEDHAPGPIDLGVIWTRTDRSFIIISSP